MEGVEKLKHIAAGFDKYGLSPLEKFLCVYKYAAGYKYPQIEKDSDFVTYGLDMDTVTRTGLAACWGAANIVNIMLGELNIPSAVNFVSFYEQGCDEAQHANNIVKLRDDYYGVRGIYGADACYDMEKTKFSHCLFPLSQTDELYKDYGVAVYEHDIKGLSGDYLGEALAFSRLRKVLGIPKITASEINDYIKTRFINAMTPGIPECQILDKYLPVARKNFHNITQYRGIEEDTIERALSAVEKVPIISY